MLNLSPPLNMNPRWFKHHVAYTMSKYGMSMCVLGMAEEFRARGIAVNALWPRTVIATAAINMLDGMVKPENCRNEQIMADAAHVILCRPSRECTGQFFLDEDVLARQGVKNFDHYAVKPGPPADEGPVPGLSGPGGRPQRLQCMRAAAAMVWRRSSSVCALDTKPASYADGAR